MTMKEVFINLSYIKVEYCLFSKARFVVKARSWMFSEAGCQMSKRKQGEDDAAKPDRTEKTDNLWFKWPP